MGSLNTKKIHSRPRTHEGAVARNINAEQQLRRSVLACMLWENTFYEDGESIADRIVAGVQAINPITAKELAIEARTQMKLRHVPLLIARELARNANSRGTARACLEEIIQRPDEITEFIKMYWTPEKQPLASQVKKALGNAFRKFDAYQLAKYKQTGKDIELRDALKLCHPRPANDEQSKMWKQLIEDTLPTPDTWETNLSDKSKDPHEEFVRLLTENKMGGLAILRNLRNFQKYNVPEQVVAEAIKRMRVDRILPFRFIAASRYAPALEPALEEAMFKAIDKDIKLPGKTVLMVDISGSMDYPLSSRSDMRRIDAANGLAILLREVCESADIYTFSNALVQVPSRRGFALRDAIMNSQRMSGTMLGASVAAIQGHTFKPDSNMPRSWQPDKRNFPARKQGYDRLIVFTDEQSHDRVPNPTKSLSYMVNIATNENGVGYKPWIHIDGWSEAIIKWIAAVEKERFV